MGVDSGDGCGIRLRHSLAHAADLWRMCIFNRQPAKDAAKKLGVPKSQTEGSVRLLRSLPRLPSPERLALVAMKDPGLTDADIGEMWGRSTRWARLVREQADEIRAAEPIPENLEWLDDGLQPGYPSPAEIKQRCDALRESWDESRYTRPIAFRIRNLSWTGDHFEILSQIA